LPSSSLAVGYIRASLDRDRQELSPDAQRASLARWCEANGVRLAAIHEDLGVSGGTALDARPGLVAALDALVAHGAGVLVVAKRDRLGRDPIVSAMIEARAERLGARVLSAAGEGNGDAPGDVLYRRIVDAFAEYERGLIRARTRAALAVKKARGERVGSVPYGRRLAADGVHVEPNPGERAVVDRVRALRAQGQTLRAIAADLDGRGVAPRGGGRWHPQTVANILRAA
jgi:DNA invertase Pin-like site-specific DNA recombinase